jgi:hypothetical protein
MKRENRATVVNDRFRDIIAQVESSSNTNHLKLLEPSQPIQLLPNNSTSCREDNTYNGKQIGKNN